MIKVDKVNMIQVQNWDQLVKDTYGKPYSFQQQEGCQPRGVRYITIPDDDLDEEMKDSIPEVINGNEMGVKFEVWLNRDPKQPLNPSEEELKNCNYYWGETGEDLEVWKNSKSHLDLFWSRNFYPDLQMVANDLHKKGLIEAGDYLINIDW